MSGGVENFSFTENDLKFKIPFGMVIGGPSSSGKTTLLLKILKNVRHLFHPIPEQIVYAYGEYHDYIPELQRKNITVVSGLPSNEFLSKCEKPLLLVLDDLMLSAREDYLQDLYTKKSHHQNIGVIFLTQNLFDKKVKVARMNSQYIILMRVPNAALHVKNFGIQIFPKQLNYFMDAYKQATENPYGYLVVDLHAGSHPSLRLHTDIFPGEAKTVFIPL